MSRYLVITADAHAGLPLPQYREWVEPRHRQAFDDRLEEDLAFRRWERDTFLEEEFEREWMQGRVPDGLRGAWDSDERTRQLDGAHVEFFRGVRNPVGVKIGPTTEPDDAVRLIDTLNPTDEAGRLVLIARMGAGNVADRLPPLLERVKKEGRRVLWMSDPMHGNGTKTASGIMLKRTSNRARSSFSFRKRFSLARVRTRSRSSSRSTGLERNSSTPAASPSMRALRSSSAVIMTIGSSLYPSISRMSLQTCVPSSSGIM